jgi:hypothetical protein
MVGAYTRGLGGAGEEGPRTTAGGKQTQPDGRCHTRPAKRDQPQPGPATPDPRGSPSIQGLACSRKPCQWMEMAPRAVTSTQSCQGVAWGWRMGVLHGGGFAWACCMECACSLHGASSCCVTESGLTSGMLLWTMICIRGAARDEVGSALLMLNALRHRRPRRAADLPTACRRVLPTPQKAAAPLSPKITRPCGRGAPPCGRPLPPRWWAGTAR